MADEERIQERHRAGEVRWQGWVREGRRHEELPHPKYVGVSEVEISNELFALIDNALELAKRHIGKGNLPFLPFLIDGERLVVLGDDFTGTQVKELGLQALSESQGKYAVFCYDGNLTVDGVKQDAAFVIACERGEQEANVFAVPYTAPRFLKRAKYGTLARYGVLENPLTG